MAHDVFISYSRKDKDIADIICKAFDIAEINYWIDRKDIPIGAAFPAEIVKAITKCKIMVFISSKDSNVSEFTAKEINLASTKKKHIIPFRIDDQSYSEEIELFLFDKNWLDYYIEKELSIQKLIKGISQYLNKTEPAFKNKNNREEKTDKIYTPECILKIRSNIACEIWIDDEMITIADANKITRIPINKGTFLLEFISLENEQDKYICEYEITHTEKLLFIDLDRIAKEREEKIAYLEKLELEKFYKKDKYGFKNKATNKIIIQAKYENTSEVFSEGLVAVRLNNKWGFIDKTGKEIIPFKYDFALIFREGLADVKLNNKWGFIDKTDQLVIPFKYDYTHYFSEGLAKVRLNNKWGFINKIDQVVIPIKYDKIGYFGEGLVNVKLNDKWGYIDKIGKEIISFKYDSAIQFSDGKAKVKFNNEEFYINKSGNRIKLSIGEEIGSSLTKIAALLAQSLQL